MKKVMLLLLIVVCCIGYVGCGPSKSGDDENSGKITFRIGWVEMDNQNNTQLESKGLAINYTDIVTYAGNEHIRGRRELRLEAYDETGLLVILDPAKIIWRCETDPTSLYDAQASTIWYTATIPGNHMIDATYEGQVASINSKVYDLVSLVYYRDDPTIRGFDFENGEITIDEAQKEMYVDDNATINCPYGMAVINNGTTFHEYVFNPGDLTDIKFTLSVYAVYDLCVVKTRNNRWFKVASIGWQSAPGLDGSFKVHFMYGEITTQ